MKELFEAAMASYNIAPTFLMLFVSFYWIIVMFGAIDMDALDIDIDLDADLDADADVEIGGVASTLSFFNIGHMPFMVFLSFWALPVWVIAILSNHYLGNTSLLIGLALLIPNFIVSLFVAKILTTPIAKFFMKLKREDEAVRPVGKMCTVILPIVEDKIGQAEIKVNGTSVLISAKTKDGSSMLKGDTALVIEHQKEKNIFIIESYSTK